MLTYPSDSLPQIVCPMEEDAISPNPFCSAPPHSEPPPPLLPLSSITPSCAKDGISGHRRSGRIQGIRAQTSKKQSHTDRGATRKPSRKNPSPTKRQRETGSMVQVSQSKQPRVESTHVHETQNEDGFDFSFAAECQNEQTDQKSPQKKTNVSAVENVVELVTDNAAQNLDATKSGMDTCGAMVIGHAAENASAPKGWVIGPLIQSFKSKMASFTEIVMSPVKLFRANSPPLPMDHSDKLAECELQANGTSDVEPSNMFQPVERGENGNQDAEANQQRLSDLQSTQNAQTSALKYSKKLAFDVEFSTHSSEHADECAITWKEKQSPDSVPLQDSPSPCNVSKQVSESIGLVIRSSILSDPSVNLSASCESNLKPSSEMEEQDIKKVVRLKPPPRKRAGNRSELKKVTSKPLMSHVKEEASDQEFSDEQLPLRNLVKSNKANSGETDETRSLSSAVCYTQLDTNCLRPEDDEDDEIKKIEICGLVRQSIWNNLNESTNGRTLTPPMDTQQLESQLNPDTYSAAGLGRSKRGLKVSCRSQLAKRKKLTVDTEDTKKQELLNIASDSGISRGLRPPRKDILSTNTIMDKEGTLKPIRKRQTVSTKVNKKGKIEQEILNTINEVVLNAQTESSPDAMLVCSLDKSSVLSENSQRGSCSSKRKPSGSCKRLQTGAGIGKPDVNLDCMDLETTMAITSTGQAQQEPSSEVLVHSDIKLLHGTSKGRNINKKPLKRKSPNQVSSMADSGSTLDSTSSVLSTETLELTATDFNTSVSVQRKESSKTGLNQPSKRSKKGLRGAVTFSPESGGAQETKQCVNNLHLITKERQCKEGKDKISIDPVYFEMTPFESNPQPVSSLSQSNLDCYVHLYNDIKQVVGEIVRGPVDTNTDHNHSSISDSVLRTSARKVNIKPRRVDKQRRRCRVFKSRTHKGEEMSSITMEDADLTSVGTCLSENVFSRRLLRSYSCPEIPSLLPQDTPWTSSLHSPNQIRIPMSQQHQSSHTPPATHAHKSFRRARRHTVCSVEVEREIAPLCLRKEVYPSRRSAPCDGATQHLSPCLALSPGASFSALASYFLSSPLAFLSKKVDGRGAAASPSASGHTPPPISPSFLAPPLGSSTWHLPAFLQRSDSSRVTLDPSSSGNPLECEIERRQQSEEEDDGEDTSSSSQEYEDGGLREEKALSDSEIKVVQKHEERGKVSSIRIRKTLPKPQNNLTPMGLPKPIRLKKKEFSLEEIYTNKNFNKPPESRLETIFEVPLNRRNGSESWFGQRRVKRYLEFLEVGEARKPKKPLVGVGKAGIQSSRTRRGCFAKDEPSLSVQDVDSLLCAKLDQLNLWLIHDQKDS